MLTQNPKLFEPLENWYQTVFPNLNLSNVKVDNNLTSLPIPPQDVIQAEKDDGYMGLYGWKIVIQETKAILEDMLQDKVIPNMQLIYYPKNGYMNWHTNSNNPSTRIYIVRSTGNPKSCMKFKDKIIYDKPLWSVNIFDVGKDSWHCVDAKTERLSLGFHYNGNTHHSFT